MSYLLAQVGRGRVCSKLTNTMCPFPIIPTLRVNNASIWKDKQKMASLIFDIDKIIDQEPNRLVNIGSLEAMNDLSVLRHGGV